ncbi:MAG: thiol reductant exporter subunit CydD [Actinomycetota bacterium]
MVVFALLAACATVVFSWQLAFVITQIFIEGVAISALTQNLMFALLAAITRATVIFAQDLVSQKTATSVKLELRQKFNLAIRSLGPNWLARQSSAQLNMLATSGLDSLDAYFSKYLPQLIYTALVTPAFLVLIWLLDPSSGLVVLVTLPLIPVFMILIGWATQRAQGQQLEALTKLSKHFLEALRSLTTLRVFGRAHAQVELLKASSELHRMRTMKVLRISFLSGFALELLASLSVALIAVSIGLRLVNGEMPLFVGLLVLLLAPEAYLPLRMVGAQFHAASDGIAASDAILEIIEKSSKGNEAAEQKQNELLQPGSITLLVGASGAGKTSLMNSFLDFSSDANLARFSWAPQQPQLFAGSVLENIIGDSHPDDHKVQKAIQLAALDDLDLNCQVGESGARVSGGQAQRIALARCFYRALMIDGSALLVDEPISALDERRAAIICKSLKWFAESGRAVLAISHQDLLETVSDRIVEINRG